MKAEAVLSFFLILIPSLSEFQNPFFLAFFNHFSIDSEQTVTGRLNEDLILPCLFESGPEVATHWKIQGQNVHSYYKGSNKLERQDPKHANRTLFHSEIHNGNDSLSLIKLNLQDDGSYIWCTGTESGKTTNKIVLKMGAFLMPMMKYETRNTSTFLTCCVLMIYPHPTITWQAGNTAVSESTMEELEPSPPFYIKSTLNVTFSNKSYECVIENSLLKQTWRGQWVMKEHLHKVQSEDISLSCQLANNFSLPNQDFIVTWSRMKSGTSSVLAYFLSSSQNTVISESQFSWNKELINQSHFSWTLTDLSLSDNGEYLCNISSSKYTLLMVHTLHVESYNPISPDEHSGNAKENMLLSDARSVKEMETEV
ncbi:LOW QUALITY PROTEIN: HERV-H LTR-associating protein 2 [Trichechus inunguis]